MGNSIKKAYKTYGANRVNIAYIGTNIAYYLCLFVVFIQNAY